MSFQTSHDLPLDWGTCPIEPGLTLRITRDMPALNPALDATVERHWQAALATHRLFNGRVFCADRITPALIEGHWTEYRRIVAQMTDPALFAALQVRSVATCGILCSPDGVAIGRREAGSIYQPGEWQLPPAGSVDQGAATPQDTAKGGADWRTALLQELREELGIDAAEAGTLTPLCLIQHPSGVLDIGIRIDTALTAAEILARHQAHGDTEYDRIQFHPPSTLVASVQAQGGTLVPAAAILLQAAFPSQTRGNAR